MNKKANKPPIGIEPEWIWTEKRREELAKAMIRRLNDPYPIPIKWVNEFNKHCETISKRKT